MTDCPPPEWTTMSWLFNLDLGVASLLAVTAPSLLGFDATKVESNQDSTLLINNKLLLENRQKTLLTAWDENRNKDKGATDIIEHEEETERLLSKPILALTSVFGLFTFSSLLQSINILKTGQGSLFYWSRAEIRKMIIRRGNHICVCT